MTLTIRPATPEECTRLWPAIASDHLFESAEELQRYRMAAPWRIRVADRGEAAVLGAWRQHSRVLAIRGVWAQERHVHDFARDARAQARAHRFSSVLSPLLPDVLLGGYMRAGMRITQHIVAIQGHPELVLPADPPLGVRIREGGPDDIAAVARLDSECFDEFWRYGSDELRDLMRVERLAVAEAEGGAVIGYTLATVSRGSATLSRLGTAPHARRCGVGRALLAESSAWAVRRGAVTLALCTQEENAASRSLYAAAGLSELPDGYAFAMGDA